MGNLTWTLFVELLGYRHCENVSICINNMLHQRYFSIDVSHCTIFISVLAMQKASISLLKIGLHDICLIRPDSYQSSSLVIRRM